MKVNENLSDVRGHGHGGTKTEVNECNGEITKHHNIPALNLTAIRFWCNWLCHNEDKVNILL